MIERTSFQTRILPAVWTLGRLVSAISVATLATLIACEKSSAPFSASPAASSNGSYSVAENADCLPDITLIDQRGRQIVLASLKGKPVLLNFIYTNCATACPLLTAKFAAVARLLGSRLGSDIRIVSITIDPDHDHPAQLLAYARSHDADYPGWSFLTGTPAEIDRVLQIFKLRRAPSADGSISHVTTSFLIGPDGRQHRIYDTLDVATSTVVRDISHLDAGG